MANIKLLGIPYDHNSSFLKGPSYAPDRIRLMDKEGSANQFAESGKEIKPGSYYDDCGDLTFETTDPQKAYQLIKSSITDLINDGNKVLSIGGDHSISYPIISAHAKKYPSLHILHFDAHADLYENFDDNPYSHASPFARVMENCEVRSLTQVGIRTLSKHQKEQADKYGVDVIEMKDFNFDFISSLKNPLYISLDIDVMDPAFAPGISHHEPGGMSTRQLIDCIQQLPHSIVGADLVEYNPMRDVNNMTAMVGYKLQKELLSKMTD